MKFSFFKTLALAIVNAKGSTGKPVGHELAVLHRELMRKPKLQAVAREHGNQRRMDAGKGRNTLKGIPA